MCKIGYLHGVLKQHEVDRLRIIDNFHISYVVRLAGPIQPEITENRLDSNAALLPCLWSVELQRRRIGSEALPPSRHDTGIGSAFRVSTEL